ncbi:PP31/39K [Parapoynx stagnalis nucleopolyhedrovirus]|uniref:PP31/39K n=1 Tax=Parapoynx stagnalis nucleopolyhedrovirus TaxID=2993413 RepID=A0A9E7Y6Z1_9ABAC|nr:PP31/39K [Parapoynx stagnalis nucleopolyhedrovirus]
MVNLTKNVLESNINKINNNENNVFHRLDNSQYNKTNMDQMYKFINMIEKKKFHYTLLVTPLLFDERKLTKRNKKVISNNKFILFNSWYTKIKQADWPVTRVMWELVKNTQELNDFVFVFDYIEKLCKKMAQRTSSSASSSSDENTINKKKKKNNVINTNDLIENTGMKEQLYTEFYKVLNETFKNDIAPTYSSIYDGTLNQEFFTNAIRIFKTNALKLPAAPAPPVSRKRKNSGDTKKRAAPTKNRRATVASTTNNYTMVNDTTQDTEISE